MKITPDIKESIKKAIDLHGNVTLFAKHLSIAHSTVLFWLSGKTTEISGKVWAQKLRPALVPWLQENLIRDQEMFRRAIPPLTAGYTPFEFMAEVPMGHVVRTRGSQRVVGVTNYVFLNNNELQIGISESFGSDKGVSQYNAKLAIVLLEVLIDGEWRPAGRKK